MSVGEQGGEEYWDWYGGGNIRCRKLHNEELHNLISLLNIIMVTGTRTMRLIGMEHE